MFTSMFRTYLKRHKMCVQKEGHVNFNANRTEPQLQRQLPILFTLPCP